MGVNFTLGTRRSGGRFRHAVWLALASVMGLAACADYVYVKPGASEEDAAAAYEACLSVARQRELPLRFGRAHHTCMLAKGYDLAPRQEVQP